MDFNHYIYEVKSISLSKRKGRKPQTLLDAARHNLREIQAENRSTYGTIDCKRSHLNKVLVGPTKAIEIVQANDKLFDLAGIEISKLRIDYQQASEHVFSLQAGQDDQLFFSVTKKIAEQVFGESLLSFVVHRDQGQPHAHLLISPIQGKLHLASERINHNGLKNLRLHFAKGLDTIGFKPPPSSRLNKEKLTEQAAKVISHLESVRHPILMDQIWPAILRMINEDPSVLFNFYQLEKIQIPKSISQERLKNLTGNASKPIGFNHPVNLKQYLPCVGFKSIDTSTSIEYSERDYPEFIEDLSSNTWCLRENELKAEYFDPETGEFHSPKPGKNSYRRVSDQWVCEELESRARTSNSK